MAKVHIATKQIADYERDIELGFSSLMIIKYAKRQAARWRRMDTWAANAAAEQLEEWIDSKVPENHK